MGGDEDGRGKGVAGGGKVAGEDEIGDAEASGEEGRVGWG